jgi:hypothetical protein
MGNSLSTENLSQRFPLQVNQFPVNNVLRNSIGNLQIASHPETKDSRTILAISFDNDEVLDSLKKGLDDMALARENGCGAFVQAHAVELHDKRLICSPSSFVVVLDHFELNLEDVIRSNNMSQFFAYESQIWSMLFDLATVIQFSSQKKIRGHFMHPRSICWVEKTKRWGFLHPAFFPEHSNYSEAMAANLHFCSPELFAQVFSGRRNFHVSDQDRSDMFSLGLIVLFILCFDSGEIDLANVYIRSQCIVDGLYLQRVINGLEKLNVSDLLMRVLSEMLNEIEHLRMSSSGFFDLLQKHQTDLENPNFRDHDKIFDNYMEMKSSNIMLSMNKDMIGKELTGPKVMRPSTVLAADRRNSIEPGHRVVVEKKKDSGFFF